MRGILAYCSDRCWSHTVPCFERAGQYLGRPTGCVKRCEAAARVVCPTASPCKHGIQTFTACSARCPKPKRPDGSDNRSMKCLQKARACVATCKRRDRRVRKAVAKADGSFRSAEERNAAKKQASRAASLSAAAARARAVRKQKREAARAARKQQAKAVLANALSQAEKRLAKLKQRLLKQFVERNEAQRKRRRQREAERRRVRKTRHDARKFARGVDASQLQHRACRRKCHFRHSVSASVKCVEGGHPRRFCLQPRYACMCRCAGKHLDSRGLRCSGKTAFRAPPRPARPSAQELRYKAAVRHSKQPLSKKVTKLHKKTTTLTGAKALKSKYATVQRYLADADHTVPKSTVPKVHNALTALVEEMATEDDSAENPQLSLPAPIAKDLENQEVSVKQSDTKVKGKGSNGASFNKMWNALPAAGDEWER